MKKILTTFLVGMVLSAGLPSLVQAQPYGGYGGGGSGHYAYHGGHHGGHSGWYGAGAVLAGVVLGGILQSAYASEPTYREVVYTQPIYQPVPVRYVQPVQYVQTAQPVQPMQVVQPVQYVQVPAAVPQAPAEETVWIENSNGSKTPIKLRRSERGQYIGPQGEYYMQYPTMEQLRQIYGI